MSVRQPESIVNWPSVHKDVIGEEWFDILPHIEDSIRSGEFEMSRLTDLLGMRSDEEREEFQAQCDASDQEDLQEAWNELQAIPSYVEQQAREFAREA